LRLFLKKKEKKEKKEEKNNNAYIYLSWFKFNNLVLYTSVCKRLLACLPAPLPLPPLSAPCPLPALPALPACLPALPALLSSTV
jgi:hypothetical protein